MKKTIITTMAAAMAASVATAGVGVSMDFASAYVYRGSTFLDGASFQPGVEVDGFGLAEEYGSVAAGVWGSCDLEGDASSTFQETDYYVSYGLPVDAVDLSIGYCEYTYGADSADKEISLGAGYEVAGVALGAGAYFMTGGAYCGQVYVDFSAGYDVPVTEDVAVSLGARLGYLEAADGMGESGFSDYDISASTSYPLSDVWSAGVSFAYIGEIDEDVVATDVNFVGMFSLACDM